MHSSGAEQDAEIPAARAAQPCKRPGERDAELDRPFRQEAGDELDDRRRYAPGNQPQELAPFGGTELDGVRHGGAAAVAAVAGDRHDLVRARHPFDERGERVLGLGQRSIEHRCGNDSQVGDVGALMRGDRVEIVIDAGSGTTRTYEIRATRAGRKVVITHGRGVVEVSETTRGGTTVRTARFLANRVLALVEHPAADEAPEDDEITPTLRSA
ncbi:MAG: hypothetical protein ACT4RN_19640 [Pseudonocardia sp.]